MIGFFNNRCGVGIGVDGSFDGMLFSVLFGSFFGSIVFGEFGFVDVRVLVEVVLYVFVK